MPPVLVQQLREPGALGFRRRSVQQQGLDQGSPHKLIPAKPGPLCKPVKLLDFGKGQFRGHTDLVNKRTPWALFSFLRCHVS